MTPPVIKSSCPSVMVKDLNAETSIGDALRLLKNEQSFLGEKLYKQLASTLVAIPCNASEQNPEQTKALSNIVRFAKTAESFRDILKEDRYGVKEVKIETERKMAKILLKQDILMATTDIQKVVYEYEPASQLASTLSTLYLKQTGKYLDSIISKENLAKKGK
jgi:hypothetical protein